MTCGRVGTRPHAPKPRVRPSQPANSGDSSAHQLRNPGSGSSLRPPLSAGAPDVLRLDRVHKSFRRPDRSGTFKAVDGVSFAVREGETLGIVGESGSGKSTALRIAMRLLDPDAGSVQILGEDVTQWSRSALRAARVGFQLVQQDPFASLDPRFPVERIIAEPLVAHRVGDRSQRRQRVAELLDAVALPRDVLRRRPRELSGGQRQRVGIARALASEPRILIADEPVSSLDQTVQATIVALLRRLRAERHLTYVIVSHDLAIIRALCDTVAVMREGVFVEVGPPDRVFDRPAHAYTRALIDAIPLKTLASLAQAGLHDSLTSTAT